LALSKRGEWFELAETAMQIAIADIAGEMARRSGFEGVVDLLKVAKHGGGTNAYLIEFEYSEPTDEID
jgi:hypothetical protein